MTQPWSAPVATTPVRATVSVPGSKSITNRALVLAAHSGGAVTVHGVPASRDSELMLGALRALGVPVEVSPAGVVRIGPHDGFHGPASVDCGLAGTVMRFVPPAAALATGEIGFDGDPRARERPMDTVLNALRALVDDGGRATAAHGAKPLMRALLGQLDADLRTLRLDTMLAAYLLDPAESRYLLADLLLRLLDS